MLTSDLHAYIHTCTNTCVNTHIHTQPHTHTFKCGDTFLYLEHWRNILRPEDHETKASLNYTVRFLKGKKMNTAHTPTHTYIYTQTSSDKI